LYAHINNSIWSYNKYFDEIYFICIYIPIHILITNFFILLEMCLSQNSKTYLKSIKKKNITKSIDFIVSVNIIFYFSQPKICEFCNLHNFSYWAFTVCMHTYNRAYVFQTLLSSELQSSFHLPLLTQRAAQKDLYPFKAKRITFCCGTSTGFIYLLTLGQRKGVSFSGQWLFSDFVQK